MRLRDLTFVLLMACALALASCGKGDGTPPLGRGAATIEAITVEGDLACLVPADTHVLVYTTSINDLQERVHDIVGAFDEDAVREATDELNGVLEEIPIHELLDRAKPMALAVTFPPDGESRPIMTVIAPVTDVAKAQECAKGAKRSEFPAAGDYVSVLLTPGEPSKPASVPAIAKHLPEGDLVVRADLAAIVGIYRKQIDAGFGEIEEGFGELESKGIAGTGRFIGLLKGFVGDLIDSAEQADLSLRVDDTSIHLRGMLTMKEGSKLADAPVVSGDLVRMAGTLPGDFPAVMLFSADFRKFADWFEPFMDVVWATLPEDRRLEAKAQWDKALSVYDYTGEANAVAFRLDESGVTFVMVTELKNAKKYFEEYDKLLSGGYTEFMASMGINFEILPRTKVAGYDVRHYRMTFDIEKMMAWSPAREDADPEAVEASRKMLAALFGEEGLTVHMADVNGRLVTVAGDDPLLERAIASAASGTGPLAGPLAKAIETAGGRPTFLLRLEGRELMKGLLGVMRAVAPPESARKIPAIADGEPIPFLVYASMEGRYYVGGISVDVGPLAELVKSLAD